MSWLGGVGGVMTEQVAQNSPLFQSLYSRYKRAHSPIAQPLGSTPSFDSSIVQPERGPQIISNSPDEAMARGRIVTQPTLAKLGESGPEAVIPLTPRPENHFQPDIGRYRSQR
jgi:hypothetical protein